MLRSAPRPAGTTGDKGGEPRGTDLPLAPSVACREPGPGCPPAARGAGGGPGWRGAGWPGCGGRWHLPWGYAAAEAAVRSPEVMNCPLKGDGETETAAPLLPLSPPSPRRGSVPGAGASGCRRCPLAAAGERGSGTAVRRLLQPVDRRRRSELPPARTGQSGMGNEAIFPGVRCVVLRLVLSLLLWFI